jgi:transcriptional regulator with XRE-family HTH domain
MATTPSNRFGFHLRRLRRAAGLTQYALAQRSGVSKQVINYLESGATAYPTWPKALALADALRVSVVEFTR